MSPPAGASLLRSAAAARAARLARPCPGVRSWRRCAHAVHGAPWRTWWGCHATTSRQPRDNLGCARRSVLRAVVVAACSTQAQGRRFQLWGAPLFVIQLERFAVGTLAQMIIPRCLQRSRPCARATSAVTAPRRSQACSASCARSLHGLQLLANTSLWPPDAGCTRTCCDPGGRPGGGAPQVLRGGPHAAMRAAVRACAPVTEQQARRRGTMIRTADSAQRLPSHRRLLTARMAHC